VFALLNLYNAITGNKVASKATSKDAEIKKLANTLKEAGSKAVVLTGLNDKNAQLITFAINKALNSKIIDVSNTLNVRQGNDAEVAQLVSDLKSGAVAGVISYNVDPVFSLANGKEFAAALKGKLSVAIAVENNDTVAASNYVLPATHFLESWGDVSISKGNYSLVQPTIQKLFKTRQLQEILLKWSGSSASYYDYLKSFWANEILEGSSWNTALHNGFFSKEISVNRTVNKLSIPTVAANLFKSVKASPLELVLYTTTGIGDGKQANNPWLQEFPDPLTRASWDNYITISQADAKRLDFTNPVKDNGAIDGDYANISVNGVTVSNVPVYIQPGQAPGSIGLALGYGRTLGFKDEMKVGVNAYPLYKDAQTIQYGVSIEKVSGTHKFACTQVQKTIAGRHDILKEVSLKDYINIDPKDHKNGWNIPAMVSYDHQEVEAKSIDLWAEHNREIGHHFNLSIDLTSCTGCGSCVVACHAENNVPVVGKNEVRVGRDMHWLRIDRYYSSGVEEQYKEATGHEPTSPKVRKFATDELGLSRAEMYEAIETEAENPQVTFQPMMCQHCNHAPCETVCPVAATTHSRQGQNHMAYNRCVGTRYCANNCPYRVRRFNWFNYSNNNEFDFHMNNEYGKMVLNPDVVVRSRGVMEKCSMCIQMTQATILKAKKEGRKIEAGEFATACSSACTTGSLQFGDVNNEKEVVTKLAADKRAYHVLDYLQTKPNVVYQVKVRNTNEA